MTRKWRDNSLVQLVRLFLIDEVVNILFTFRDKQNKMTKWIERSKTFSTKLYVCFISSIENAHFLRKSVNIIAHFN